MQVTETNAEGLKREFKVVVPAQDIEDRIASRLKEVGQSVRIPGFRPGKVPLKLLRQRYGAAVMGEVLEKAVSDTTQSALDERGLRPAMQPKIEITSFDEGKDLEFTIGVETLPEIEPMDLGKVSIERPKVEVPESEVDEAIERLAKAREDSKPVARKRQSKKGDILVIDFVGRLDGEEFEGGKGEGVSVKLGEGRFIPGFEEQIIGMKPDEEKVITVTFPEDYGAEKLRGREAEFTVTAKELREPVPAEINDDLAKGMGLEDLAALRKAVREELERDYESAARDIVKRRLLDILAENHDFPVPQGMVDAEFDAIWKQLQHEKEHGHLDPEDEGKSDEELEQEYRAIAERRVRLGLLLSEVGRRNNIQVTQEDLNRALVNEARRFPGQEAMVFQYYQNNPEALNSLRAPVYEDKTIDFMLELATVNEQPVSPEQLKEIAEGLGRPNREDGGKAKKKAGGKAKGSTAKGEAGAKGAAAKGAAAKKKSTAAKGGKSEKAEKAGKAEKKEA